MFKTRLFSTIVHGDRKSSNAQDSYTLLRKVDISNNRTHTLLGESAKFQNEGFGMNVIVSAPKLSKAEHQSPSEIQMDCLLIGPEVSF